MPNGLRSYLASRSISFRLYRIILPITILAILMISYVDSQVVSRLLEWEIRDNALNIAGSLAQDLSRIDAPDPEGLHSWLGQLLETNSYIRRIDVFRMVGGNLSRIDSTSSSNAPYSSTKSETRPRRCSPSFSSCSNWERSCRPEAPRRFMSTCGNRPTGPRTRACPTGQVLSISVCQESRK